jgi:hypothetical protein
MIPKETCADDAMVCGCDAMHVSQPASTNGKQKPPRPVFSPAAQPSGSSGPSGVVLGTLVGINPKGQPIIELADSSNGCSQSVKARSTIQLAQSDVGRQAVLAFELNDRRKPIVLGLCETQPESSENVATDLSPAIREIVIDGEKLLVNAEREIVLQCGEASITLTRAGKIIIRGTYVLSRSSGVNSIKGGSIQLN